MDQTKASPNMAGAKNPSIVDDFMYGSNVAASHITIRLGFIRKVYGILAAQLAFTTLVGMVMMYSTGLRDFVKENNWLLMVNLLGTFVVLIALMVKRTEYPYNYYLLGLFTLFESFSIGFVVSMHDTWVVIQAFMLTTVTVLGLTAYTFQSKRDFRPMSAALSSLLMLLIFSTFFHIFFQSELTHTVLSVLGAFLFSCFIIFDTQMIMKHLSPEEYIVGVINLYLDIINLFLEILKILNSTRD